MSASEKERKEAAEAALAGASLVDEGAWWSGDHLIIVDPGDVDARHIALSDPQTVLSDLALLDAYRELEAASVALSVAQERWGELVAQAPHIGEILSEYALVEAAAKVVEVKRASVADLEAGRA